MNLGRRIASHLRVERVKALQVLGAGYALLLLGGTLAGANSDATTMVGISILFAGTSILVLGLSMMLVYWQRNAEWDAPKLEDLEELPNNAADYKPNYGVGKLPRPGDVGEVIRFAHMYIDERLFYTPEQLENFIQINPGALRCVRTSQKYPTQITGYYILLALSGRGEGLIKDGAIDVGVAMPASVTVNDPINSRAYYIGMYQGLSTLGKNEITFSIIAHVQQLCREAGEAVRVYARSGHSSSRLMMDQLGFRPIKINGQDSQIEATTLHPGDLDEIVHRNHQRQDMLLRRAQRHSAAS